MYIPFFSWWRSKTISNVNVIRWYRLVQWWCHFTMLLYLHVVSYSKQTTRLWMDDHTMFLRVLPIRKIGHCSGKIWSTFVTVLWFSKTKLQTTRDICSCESLVKRDFHKVSCQFWHCSLKAVTILSNWNNVEKNSTFSLFETIGNGNVTFAYIMRFYCTSVYAPLCWFQTNLLLAALPLWWWYLFNCASATCRRGMTKRQAASSQ